MDLPAILERIEHRLEIVGLSASAASKAAGKSDAIRNLQRAVSEKRRVGLSTATINALAPVLQTTPVWLLAGAGPEEHGDAPKQSTATPGDDQQLVTASFGGLVEAGSFRRVDEIDEAPHDPIVTLRDKKFPRARLVAFDVAGDSMNALDPRPIFSGDRVIALNLSSLGHMPLRDGMVVVVEQVMGGGHLRERSIKQIELYDDRTEFCPRSTNRIHKPIVVPKDPKADDGRTVQVIAIVRAITNQIPL